MTFLYRYEAKSIQQFVSASGKLREILGASALIESLGNDARERAASAGGSVLSAAAGGATITFPDAIALERFAGKWIQFCAQTRPGLHVAHAWIEQQGSEPRWDPKLQQKLAADRQRRLILEPPATPLVALAPRSGRPAVKRGASNSPRLLVDAMAQAQERAAARQEDPLFKRTCDVPGVRPVYDLDQFGEGYIAVVHADGNNLGALFSGLRLVEYAEISSAVGTCTEGAVRAAVRVLATRSAAPADGSDARLRFRPVVLGGDDLTAILPAEYALPFTIHFLEELERRTAEHDALRKTGRITASAGIAIVKPGYPFRSALALAEELCGAAKRPFRGLPSAPSSVIFHRVTTPALRQLDDIVREELTGEGEARSLVAGPWGVGDDPRGTKSLCRLAGALGAVPRGAVREWLGLAKASGARADSYWRRIVDVAHLEARRGWAEFAEALENTGCTSDGPWRPTRSGGSMETPLLDALTWSRLTNRRPELWEGTP